MLFGQWFSHFFSNSRLTFLVEILIYWLLPKIDYLIFDGLFLFVSISLFSQTNEKENSLKIQIDYIR